MESLYRYSKDGKEGIFLATRLQLEQLIDDLRGELRWSDLEIITSDLKEVELIKRLKLTYGFNPFSLSEEK